MVGAKGGGGVTVQLLTHQASLVPTLPRFSSGHTFPGCCPLVGGARGPGPRLPARVRLQVRQVCFHDSHIKTHAEFLEHGGEQNIPSLFHPA